MTAKKVCLGYKRDKIAKGTGMETRSVGRYRAKIADLLVRNGNLGVNKHN